LRRGKEREGKGERKRMPVVGDRVERTDERDRSKHSRGERQDLEIASARADGPILLSHVNFPPSYSRSSACASEGVMLSFPPSSLLPFSAAHTTVGISLAQSSQPSRYRFCLFGVSSRERHISGHHRQSSSRFFPPRVFSNALSRSSQTRMQRD
jgi:hypothetical protein